MEAISVIIPTHGDYEALARTMMNVIMQAQKTTHRELIVVSDGEDELSRKIALGFGPYIKTHGQDAVVRYMTHPKCGNGNQPRNMGLAAATCPWVAFQDSGTSVVGIWTQVLSCAFLAASPDWLVWDTVLLVDPAPTYAAASFAKLVDKSKGLPYCVNGIAAALRRELAQAVTWPNVPESDWAYFSQVWDNLVAKTGSIKAAQARMEFIPSALGIAYGATQRQRRVRQHVTLEDLDKALCLQGWTKES